MSICENVIKLWGNNDSLNRLKDACSKPCTLLTMAQKLNISLDCDIYRGNIRGSVILGDTLIILSNTWNPLNEFWDQICAALSIEYASKTEEPTEDIFYIHNDPDKKYFPENYALDICRRSDELAVNADRYYFESKEEAADWLYDNAANARAKKNSFRKWLNYFTVNNIGCWNTYVRD